MSGPTLLVVLDGFGLGDGGDNDATAVAHAPFFERARRSFPHAQIETSGEAVGLPPGQMGNSEVGHMTMGAGRVIDQDMTRISRAFANPGVGANRAITAAVAATATGRSVHLIGLVSDGGVHSHVDHLISLLRFCGERKVRPVLHALLDGRDTPPRSALRFLETVLPHVEAAGGHVATVIGRYWAMDRDNRWERVQRAYDAIVCREGMTAPDALAAVRQSYDRDEGDEFVAPTVIEGGAALGDGDSVICFNFRADRAREITNVLTGARPELFEGAFERRAAPDLAAYVCMTEYAAEYALPVAFAPHMPSHILGEILASARLPQLRMAETEKYAHVTFFFNNGREKPFEGEERVLVPSPRDVATYDHKPEMSAEPLTRELLDHLERNDYAFVLVNFANPDMVGHTGVLPAAVKAVETIDRCLERVVDKVLALGGQALITADHGNCEQMVDPETGDPHTAHTTNPVPLYWATNDPGGRTVRDGGLADLAPTLLELLEIPTPAEMTGQSLLVPAGTVSG